jgi:hypothetical protein
MPVVIHDGLPGLVKHLSFATGACKMAIDVIVKIGQASVPVVLSQSKKICGKKSSCSLTCE